MKTPSGFFSMVALRVPTGAGNGLPLKGKSPAAMFGAKPSARLLPLAKAKSKSKSQ